MERVNGETLLARSVISLGNRIKEVTSHQLGLIVLPSHKSQALPTLWETGAGITQGYEYPGMGIIGAILESFHHN